MTLSMADRLQTRDEIFEKAVSLLPPAHLREPLKPTLKALAYAYLYSYRTVYMGGGRQSGKTTWLVEQLHKEPTAVLLVPAGMAKETAALSLQRGNPEAVGRIWEPVMETVDTEILIEQLSQAKVILLDDVSANRASEFTVIRHAGVIRDDVVIVHMR
jgi:hypothetical protein